MLALAPVLALVAVAGLAAVAAGEVSSPPGRDLGTLGGDRASAEDVDGDVVVGWSSRAEGSPRAFAYDLDTGTMRGLGTLGGPESRATAVDGPTVVGSSQLNADSSHAFAYDLGAGTMRDLGTLGGRHSFAVDVSGRIVVGYSTLPHAGGRRAFAYDLRRGSMRRIGSLGGGFSFATAVDGDVVVGVSAIADGQPPGGHAQHAFAYDLSVGTMRDLGTLGGPFSAPVAVDGDTVVGWSDTATGAQHAFAYDLASGTMRDLGTLGGGGSGAVDVDDNTVVGWAQLAESASRHAFAYDLGTGTMRDLGVLNGLHTDSEAIAVDGDIAVGRSGFSSNLDDPSSRAVAYNLRTGTVVALRGVRDQDTPVALSGGVVAGVTDSLRYDRDDPDVVTAVIRRSAVWSLGVAFDRPTATVTEDAGATRLVVQRGGDTTAPVTVDYARTGGTATPGTDFTLAPGSLTFAAGESTKTISLDVADDARREPAESVVVALTPRDTATLMGAPTTTRVTVRPSDQRPDARISTRPSSGYVGAHVFNSTGARQTRRLAVTRGHARSFYVRVGNPGKVRNTFALTAARPARDSRVRYFVAGKDVTAALRSPDGLRRTRRAGASTLVRGWVKVRSTAVLGSRKAATVTATWSGDRQRRDTVRAVVRVVR